MNIQTFPNPKLSIVSVVTFDPWIFANDSVTVNVDGYFGNRMLYSEKAPWTLDKGDNTLVTLSDGRVIVLAADAVEAFKAFLREK